MEIMPYGNFLRSPCDEPFEAGLEAVLAGLCSGGRWHRKGESAQGPGLYWGQEVGDRIFSAAPALCDQNYVSPG